MKRPLLSALLLTALTLPVSAGTFDGADPGVRPQDDLFLSANGGWLNQTRIPGDKASYGTFTILDEQADREVRALLEEAAKNPAKSKESQLIGDYYASLMDVKTLDRLGLRPLKSELERIERVKTRTDLARRLGELWQIGVDGPIGVIAAPDDKNPLVNAVTWGQSGLGMPDRDYYLNQSASSEAQRKGYVRYLGTILKLAGHPRPNEAASAVMAFETKLATLQWARADLRDPLKTYNFSPRSQWTRLYGNFPWETFAQAAFMPSALGAIVNEPSYFEGLATLAAETSLDTWKAYLRCRLLDAYAPFLSRPFREAHFRFHDQTLQGVATMPERWKVAVGEAGEAVGEAIGARYVEKRFSPEAKQRVKKLVDNLILAYRESLDSLDWMTPTTRQAAKQKLAKIRVKVGYPDQWRGYQGLSVRRDDAVGNVKGARRFLYLRSMKEAGKKVDRSRWEMTPQTVNAYYNPVGNEIVFPAAILQPPFFDPKGDDAFNYGGIGAVIGHEITHGFDDQGRNYDGDGRLRSWWTPADETAFKSRAARLIEQYSSYEPLPGQHIDGRLTLGENIADLGGVTMALRAYHRSLGGKQPPVIEQRTGDQRFFLSFARVWRIKKRPAALQKQLVGDPHSPGQYRANGVVTNLDGFYDAFGLKAGDRLYKAPAERVRIW
ncbi:MAG: M13 family metallopeptidase [Bacteroidota bacterium]